MKYEKKIKNCTMTALVARVSEPSRAPNALTAIVTDMTHSDLRKIFEFTEKKRRNNSNLNNAFQPHHRVPAGAMRKANTKARTNPIQFATSVP
jgi:hypothetical protein